MSDEPAESNPGDRRGLDRAVAYSQILANLFVIVGIGIGAWTFLIERDDSRLAQKREVSLRFVMLRQEPVYLDAAASISQAFRSGGRMGIMASNQEEDKLDLLKTIMGEVGLQRIQTMSDFYLSVLNCVAAKICDSEVIDKSFKFEIATFYCLNSKVALPELARVLNDPEYAKPLKNYAGDCASLSTSYR